jgi:Fe-S cluster assembly protein SufD
MEKQLRTDFKKIIDNSNFSEKEIITKEKYLNKFIQNGFPGKKNEDWKFLDLNQVIKSNIENLDYFNENLPNEVDPKIYVDGLEHNKIVFINGRIEKIDFKYEESDKFEIKDQFDSECLLNDVNSLVDLNSALTNKYYKIQVKEHYTVKKPVIIYSLTTSKISSKNINIRLDFDLESNSSLKIIDYSIDKSENNFVNIVYNFNLEKDAILKNYKLDKEENNNIKYSYNNINLDTNSVAENFILSLGSSFIKNEINCNLNGKYSSAFVNGIFNLDNNKNHEIRTSINHLNENTKSYQLIKSVLGENTKSAYQGKIFVKSNAQKTDGYQLSKAILLSDNSEFNAKPELEIYADDVKCSHGSASGSLNQDSIFYLMSRGLNYKEAKELLINGFLLDVVEKITDNEIKNLIKNIMGLKE